MHTTFLEDYVSTLYQNIGIFTPEDINIKKSQEDLISCLHLQKLIHL